MPAQLPPQPGPSGYRGALLVACLTLLLFAPTAFLLRAPVTYLSAVRIAGGELLYRDMWTMYAPGSMYTLALLFKLFGVHVIIGNIVGVAVSTAAVVALYRLALEVARPWAAGVVALVFACAFFGAGYQNAFESYPPAILCVLVAALYIGRHAASGDRQNLVIAGLLLGVGVLFKHDVAGYACIAAAASMLLIRQGSVRETLGQIAFLATIVTGVFVPVLLYFIWAGAGPAMLEDLLIFPTGYFPVVRPEEFPLLPPMSLAAGRLAWAREMNWWVILHAPTVALVAGCFGLLGCFRKGRATTRRILVFALVAYALFWSAAHVQANTHKITMAAFGALVGAAGLLHLGSRDVRELGWLRPATALFLLVWVPALVAEPVAMRLRDGARWERVRLPRFEGIVAPSARVEEMHALRAAIAEAGPPDAPLLVLGWRNDVMIAGSSLPYWLSDRRIATVNHELHPGVTDTEPVQRQMLADADTDPPPVVVIEFRFPGPFLDMVGEQVRAGGVPVGATLLDEWVAENYVAGPRFGVIQVMHRKP